MYENSLRNIIFTKISFFIIKNNCILFPTNVCNCLKKLVFYLLENNVAGYLIRKILKILEEILVTYPNISQIQHMAYILPEIKIKQH